MEKKDNRDKSRCHEFNQKDLNLDKGRKGKETI
jgi:hypothetical protein